MSRLLLYQPRKLAFKHYLEKDLSKWCEKYRSKYNTISDTGQALAMYGRIKLLEAFYVIMSGKIDGSFYNELAENGSADYIDKNILSSTMLNLAKSFNRRKNIIIQVDILMVLIFHNIQQIDIIYSLVHIISSRYIDSYFIRLLATSFSENYAYHNKILLGLYNHARPSIRRKIYQQMLQLDNTSITYKPGCLKIESDKFINLNV